MPEHKAFENLVNDCLNNDKQALEAILELSSLDNNQIHLMQQKVTAVLSNEPDNSNALFLAARMHHKGLGRPVNFPEAARLYKGAIDQGNAYAMNSRAYMLELGQGESVNIPEAVHLYELAIAKGHTSAMTNYALMHQKGHNYHEAIRLYELAIDKGDDLAMYNRALMYRKGQGGLVNFPEAIRLLERAIAKGNAYAMNGRAWMHQHGEGGPKDYNVAAKLFRQAYKCKNNTQKEITRKNIVNLSNAPDLDTTSEGAYHICLTLNNNLWQRNPTVFLSFLARDDLLTDKEWLAILATWIQALPDIATIKDQPSIDLIGEYYFQPISVLLAEQWNLKVSDDKRSELLNNAIDCLHRIPKNAKSYHGACHAIATNSYHQTLKHSANETAAFINAQAYFHEGALGDDLCQFHYLQLLQSFLQPKQDTLWENDEQQKIRLLETEHTKDIRFITAIPALINQAILVTDEISNTSGSDLFTTKDLTYGSRNQVLSLRDKIAKNLQGEVLLNKNTPLTSAEIITLARKYLALINETKNQIPLRNYKQEVLQALDKIATKIEECIALHGPDYEEIILKMKSPSVFERRAYRDLPAINRVDLQDNQKDAVSWSKSTSYTCIAAWHLPEDEPATMKRLEELSAMMEISEDQKTAFRVVYIRNDKQLYPVFTVHHYISTSVNPVIKQVSITDQPLASGKICCIDLVVPKKHYPKIKDELHDIFHCCEWSTPFEISVNDIAVRYSHLKSKLKMPNNISPDYFIEIVLPRPTVDEKKYQLALDNIILLINRYQQLNYFSQETIDECGSPSGINEIVDFYEMLVNCYQVSRFKPCTVAISHDLIKFHILKLSENKMIN